MFSGAQITAVRMKLLLKQVVGHLLTGEMDRDKVAKLTSESLSGGLSDTKGAVAALHFILFNSAKSDIDDNTLQLEIQQLGASPLTHRVVCPLFASVLQHPNIPTPPAYMARPALLSGPSPTTCWCL